VIRSLGLFVWTIGDVIAYGFYGVCLLAWLVYMGAETIDRWNKKRRGRAENQ